MTETWLNDNDDDDCILLCASDVNNQQLKILLSPRRDWRGGRVAIIYDKKYDTTQLDAVEAHTSQYAKWQVLALQLTLTIIASYRPPNVSSFLFLDEFLGWIADPIAMNPNIIVASDFNLHINNPNDYDSFNFINAMTAVGLKQHIQLPTHRSGNYLDLILTEDNGNIVIKKCYPSIKLSNRCIVEWHTSITPRQLIRKTITVRPLGDLDYELCAYDIKKEYSPNDNIDTLVSDFEKSQTDFLDSMLQQSQKL